MKKILYSHGMNITDTGILVKALAATRSPVTITDNRLRDNPIVYCNAAFLELTGYEKSEVMGRNCRFLQGDKTKQPQLKNIREGMQNKTDSRSIIRNYTKSGRPFWNDLQISPVYDDKGELTHFIGLQLDVTLKVEQSRADARARKLKAKNELLELERNQLQKLNVAKDDFISVASHQLRTPATAVKQYLGMLEMGTYGQLDAAQLSAIKSAYESNDRQLQIIDKLLQIARIDAGKIIIKREPVHIIDMIYDVAAEFKFRMDERQQTLKLPEKNEDIVLNVDKELIRTVLENLLDNAIKYSDVDTGVAIGVERKDNCVHITLSDHGVGMSKKNIEKLFDKFTRIENSTTRDIGGSGLGLYWVRKVMDLHGAKIYLSSVVGKGSEITLDFDCADN